jgi:hypothetical protein
MEHRGSERDDGLEADPQAVLEHALYAARCEIARLRAQLASQGALTTRNALAQNEACARSRSSSC